MSFRSVIVHVGDDRHVESRLRLAADLGRAFLSTVTGVGALAWDPTTTPRAPAYAAAQALKSYERVVQQRLEAAKRNFEAGMEGYPFGVAWREQMEFPRIVMARAANGADIVVASPTENDPKPYHYAEPGDLIMETGLPVVVAPLACDTLDLDVVAIGWKATREARRAISAALPLLTRARKVVLIRVDAEPADSRTAAETADVCERLKRHEIEVELVVEPAGEDSDADVLIRAAKQRSAGMLVVGGYGHSRLQEWAFGGVTRGLLRDPALPIFFAH